MWGLDGATRILSKAALFFVMFVNPVVFSFAVFPDHEIDGVMMNETCLQEDTKKICSEIVQTWLSSPTKSAFIKMFSSEKDSFCLNWKKGSEYRCIRIRCVGESIFTAAVTYEIEFGSERPRVTSVRYGYPYTCFSFKAEQRMMLRKKKYNGWDKVE